MFDKTSRYQKLPDVVTTDAQGRALQSKTWRPLPEVSGTFRHTVEQVDRLDHLAYKYYRQPRRWWRICDANPQFMSPQALLGQEPIVADRFPLTWDDGAGQPPWAELLSKLSTTVGVEALQVVEEEVELIRQAKEGATVLVPRYERAVIVTYNRMNVRAAALANLMVAAGFQVGQPETIGRIGKQIIIAPNVVG